MSSYYFYLHTQWGHSVRSSATFAGKTFVYIPVDIVDMQHTHSQHKETLALLCPLFLFTPSICVCMCVRTLLCFGRGMSRISLPSCKLRTRTRITPCNELQNKKYSKIFQGTLDMTLYWCHCSTRTTNTAAGSNSYCNYDS